MQRSLSFPPSYAHLEQSFIDIRTLFNADTNTIHKARNELKIIDIEGKKCVVKSFKTPHLFNRIVYTYFRHSKAYKSYHNALRLQKLSISTPEPMALIEFYPSGLLGESFFISELFDYDFTIRTPLLESIEDKSKIFEAFAAFTYDLHQKGVWHLDYSPGNILIKRLENGYQFSIVDINRMKFCPISPIKGCENFNKLWASDQDLEIMGREYARLGGLDETFVIREMQRHNNTNKRTKNFKKQLKRWLKGDFSTHS